jgi:adenine-specific DNA-methyltransferase
MCECEIVLRHARLAVGDEVVEDLVAGPALRLRAAHFFQVAEVRKLVIATDSTRTIANDDHPERILVAFNDVYRVMKPDTFYVSFYGWNRVDAFLAAWRRAGFVSVSHLVWQKNYASSRGFLEARHEQTYLLAKGRPAKPAQLLSDVRPWRYRGNSNHPTEKAVSILRPLIESFSNPRDVVLDPFAGSGSTCLAAAECGCRYFGIELRTCAAAARRVRDIWRVGTVA